MTILPIYADSKSVVLVKKVVKFTQVYQLPLLAFFSNTAFMIVRIVMQLKLTTLFLPCQALVLMTTASASVATSTIFTAGGNYHFFSFKRTDTAVSIT